MVFNFYFVNSITFYVELFFRQEFEKQKTENRLSSSSLSSSTDFDENINDLSSLSSLSYPGDESDEFEENCVDNKEKVSKDSYKKAFVSQTHFNSLFYWIYCLLLPLKGEKLNNNILLTPSLKSRKCLHFHI
jgi:hypothetical protein